MKKKEIGTHDSFFFNRSFDKGRLKNLISWYLVHYGESPTITLLEELKVLGFHHATQAGISLSIDDLLIPDRKVSLLREAEISIQINSQRYERGDLTSVERFQHMIDTWHLTSENIKNEVVHFFRSKDPLNPVYMMAFSGARGNLSQVRQLVGMRGLMADPQGQIIDFPISSNFREGLTLTEYVISCYGARKGIVDTALRTANSGYLTRRLVDVAQHLLISRLDCGTEGGVQISALTEGRKTLFSLKDRLIGRVLARDIANIASKNTIIDPNLANQLENYGDYIFVRSPLICQARDSLCQLCYGWSLAHKELVSVGEAVGIIAAQSIGEPGTQLTMRTFHTGGVFSGDALDQIRSPVTGLLCYHEPYSGELIRTAHGKIAFLIKTSGKCTISPTDGPEKHQPYDLDFPEFSILFVQDGKKVTKDEIIAEYTSISTQNNQSVGSKQSLIAPFEGQVYFQDVVIAMKKNAKEEKPFTWEFGTFWILKGLLKESKMVGSLFAQPGDMVYQDAPLSELFFMSSLNGKVHLNPILDSHHLDFLPESSHSSIAKNGVISAEIKIPFSNLFWSKQNYHAFYCPKERKQSFSLRKLFYFSPSSELKWRRTTKDHSSATEGISVLKSLCSDSNRWPLPKQKRKAQIQMVLNVGLTYCENQSRNGQSPIFGLMLENFEIHRKFIHLYHLRAGTKRLHQEEYFNVETNLDFFNGFLSSASNEVVKKAKTKRFTLAGSRILEQGDSTVPRERRIYRRVDHDRDWQRKSLSTHLQKGGPTHSKKGEPKFVKLFNEWIFSDFPLSSLQNRQGMVKSTPIDFEGFLTGYFFTWEKQDDRAISTIFSRNPIKSKESTTENHDHHLLFSIKKGWPYVSKSPTIYKGKKKIANSKKQYSLQGKSPIDDILFDFPVTKLQIQKMVNFEEFPDFQNGEEYGGTHFKNSFPNHKKTKPKIVVNFHLSNYPSSKTKSIWFSRKNHQQMNHPLNPIFVIQPLSFSNTSTAQTEFSKAYTKNCQQKNQLFSWKNVKNRKKTEACRFFHDNHSSLFYEPILNLKTIVSEPIQKPLIRSSFPPFHSLLSLRKLNFLFAYLPFFIHFEQDPVKKPIYPPRKIRNWEFSFFPCIDFKVSEFYPFKTYDQPNISLNNSNQSLEKGPGIRKSKWNYSHASLKKEKSDRIFFQKKNGESIFKDQLLVKRQRLNSFLCEALYSYPPSKKRGTSKIHEKDSLTQLLFGSKKDFVCYDTASVYQREKSNPQIKDASHDPQDHLLSLFGSLIRPEQKLWNGRTVRDPGRIISVRKNGEKIILTLRKGQPFLFSSRAVVHAYHNDFVKKDSLLLTLLYRRLQTGDIVQGIPKIEELFEARSSKFGKPLVNSAPIKLNNVYERLARRMPFQKAVRQSILIIQKDLVDHVQRVYQSQGVTIADKHLEIIVRQMTSKVKIIDGGNTGFVSGEFVQLDMIELINLGTVGPGATYKPAVLGITKASLETRSFISAASFQETTRILARAAVAKKIDFLKGLKENVILGHVIPAGTGSLGYSGTAWKRLRKPLSPFSPEGKKE
uniref:DNA-directed RNA polymerase subunit beta'' n=1 Tax=Marsupiomonas sp. NIES 1824 TaxID=1562198 RepID=A0A097KLX4_9CHLO|nr:beta'' subunit of RNA polymerase [Marsupiomonas sp. NIES 1824]